VEWHHVGHTSRRSPFDSGRRHYRSPRLMPRATICLECGRLISRGPRCPTCVKARQDKHNADTTFYRSPEWRRLRSVVIRTGCLVCGTHDHVIAHHVVPRAEGGTDTIDNLRPLCVRHHNQIEADLRAGRQSPLRTLVEGSDF
jgi:5-methylcytosine-specific restriction endonuclease McrA